MNKLNVWLSGLLILQILLASGIFISARSGQSGYASKPLLAFDQSKINKIIVNSDDAEVTMLRSDTGWSLPNLNGLPVNPDRLDSAFNKLKGLQSNWPVTTTASSHERFEVSGDKYQRRIRLYQDDQLVDELYLGSSPGFKKVHVRPANDNNVYALALNNYDFPSRQDDWLNKSLLAAKDPTSIKGPDYALHKTDSQWQFDGLNESEHLPQVNIDKVNQLSQAFTTFLVSSVVENAPDFASADAITIEVSGTDQWRYQFLEKDEKYYVKRDDKQQAFTLSQHDFNRLAGVKMSDLKLVEKEQPSKVDVEADVPDTIEGN